MIFILLIYFHHMNTFAIAETAEYAKFFFDCL